MNLLAKIIVPIFGKIAARRGDKMREQLQKDPEIIKLQKGIQDDMDEIDEMMKLMKANEAEDLEWIRNKVNEYQSKKDQF